jgi:phenylalanyl-tRNA synthetase beta chain
MKYSYNWLKKLSGTKLSAEKVAELLTMHSFELESLTKVGGNFENIVIGKILEIKKHPNADKLQLVKVDVGKRAPSSPHPSPQAVEGAIGIVCGAWNIKVGDKVPVALVGAKLPSGLVIKEAEIRGVKSFGMLCAEDELGLGTDHSGIMILDKEAKVGNTLTKELEMEDILIELDILANRGHDALSHISIAREICALEGRKMAESIKSTKSKKSLKSIKSKVLSVEVKDKKICPRYFAAVMENIEVKESPAWIKSVFRNLGIKSINNIVDATNYVMLELGQPLHAFDLDRLTNKERIKDESARIIIRSAKDGEEIKLLDGSVKKLENEDIVIANENKILALAGVMGGEDSGINKDTKTIVIESANFNPRNIRKTRMRLGLQTDASMRFEKGIDPNLAEMAMARVVEIISWMDGKVEGAIDFYPNKIKPWKIKLNLDYVKKLLGEEIRSDKVLMILRNLNLGTKKIGSEKIEVEIPTIRIDLKTQEDLIEEVGRVYGYENIKPQVPHAPVQTPEIDGNRLFVRNLKNILCGTGFSEVYNYSFYSRRDSELAQVGAIEHLELSNPINPNQELMRVNLIIGLIKNAVTNWKNFSSFRIFEIGRSYRAKNNDLPEEKMMLAGILADKEGKKQKAYEFYELKGMVETLLQSSGFSNWYFDEFNPASDDTLATLWHEGRTAEIKIEGTDETVGFIGELNPLVLTEFGIHERLAAFEIDIEKLLREVLSECEYQPIRKYPAVERDISMLVESDVRVDDVLRSIQKGGGNLVLDVDLFDIYDLPDEERTSFAFHISFGADERTLESQEVDVLMARIIDNLEKDLKVRVRV